MERIKGHKMIEGVHGGELGDWEIKRSLDRSGGTTEWKTLSKKWRFGLTATFIGRGIWCVILRRDGR